MGNIERISWDPADIGCPAWVGARSRPAPIGSQRPPCLSVHLYLFRWNFTLTLLRITGSLELDNNGYITLLKHHKWFWIGMCNAQLVAKPPLNSWSPLSFYAVRFVSLIFLFIYFFAKRTFFRVLKSVMNRSLQWSEIPSLSLYNDILGKKVCETD